MDKIRIVIVAPTLAVRAGLRALLASAGASASLEVVDEAARLGDLEAIPAEADLLLVAAEPHHLAELERLLQTQEGQTALLWLTDDPQAAQGVVGLPLRAWGVLSYDASGEELAAAATALHEGLWVGAPALLGGWLPRFLSAEAAPPDVTVEPLTERESEVLQLLARGLANKQIAVSLGISEHTVKFHVSSIYTKLGVTNRTEAVRMGVKQGLVVL